MHDLTAIRVFVAVAETQSFAAAARRLRLSTSVVSHHVAKLEGMLGVPLLNRSTRRVGLTEDGVRYFRRAKPLVDEAEALFRETREHASDVSGRLKLAVPPGIAEHLILPPTLDFIHEHPGLDVVLDVDPRQTDVIRPMSDRRSRSNGRSRILYRTRQPGALPTGPGPNEPLPPATRPWLTSSLIGPPGKSATRNSGGFELWEHELL